MSPNSLEGTFGFQFLLALYLQSVTGDSSVRTGMAYLPGPIVIAVISLGCSAEIITRFGARTVLLAGMVITAVALALLGRLPVHASYSADILPSVLLLGVGARLSLPAAMGLAMSGATPADSGLASGLVNTTQQIGGALGVAILAALAGSRTDTLASQGKSPAEAATGGYHTSFLVAAGCRWWARSSPPLRCAPRRPTRSPPTGPDRGPRTSPCPPPTC
ncbi:MFS transporter [Streptomyces sp. NPDC059894]|uniref:MFS transporter n=1 Tax=unclassified Streptomyces TaxID=2593676 RepID=UPI00365D15D9